MDMEIIDTKIREKLEPHLEAMAKGAGTEYDILPTVLLTLVNKQADILGFQVNSENITHKQLDNLNGILDVNNSLQSEILIKINELNDKQEELSGIYFMGLKSSQEAGLKDILDCIQNNNNIVAEFLERQMVFENSLVKVQSELAWLKKMSFIGWVFYAATLSMLGGILFLLIK